MRFLVLNSLRYRKSAFAGAFVALFCAAALVSACATLMDTGLRGSVAPERYAGTPVVVSGDLSIDLVKQKKDKTKIKHKAVTERPWLPLEVADRLRTVPGVSEVVPEVEIPVYLERGSGERSWGHSWDSAVLTPFTIGEGREPRRSGEIAVDGGAVPGDVLTVRTPTGTRDYTVVGVTAQRLASQRSVFFAPEEAPALARPGMAAAFGVFGEVSAADLRAELSGTEAEVHTGDARGNAEFPDASAARTRLMSMGGALAGTSLIVAVLAVSGIFALAGLQRRRELALLRAVAATPAQLSRMLGQEALIVALAAAVPGALTGLLLAGRLHEAFVDLGAIPPNLPLVTGFLPAPAAIAGSLAAAWAAARLSGRRAGRVRPVEALGEAAPGGFRIAPLRVAAGVAAAGGAVVLTLTLSSVSTDRGAGPLTPLTALVWSLAAALLGPLLVRVVAAVIAPPLRRTGAAGRLAAEQLRTGADRAAAVVAPLTLVVALGCTLLAAGSTLDEAAEDQLRDGIRAGLVVGPKVPAQDAQALRRMPGVEAVTEVVRTTVRTVSSPYRAQGVTPEGLDKTMDLRTVEGSLVDLREGTMAVQERLGMAVGDLVEMALGDGTPVTAEVVAVYRSGLGFAQVTLPYATVAGHVDDPMSDFLLVAGRGITGADISAALGGSVGAASPSAALPGTSSANYVALGMIIAFAVISLVNTLAVATLGRSRELALLRLVGATKSQIMRSLAWETLPLALLATGLGTAIALVTLSAYASAMAGGALTFPGTTYATVVAAGVLPAFAALLLAGRAALRPRPTDALGFRE
ncbi:putative ABC transport system permease protein [Actinocorallia herbida]|uniref:Putative ABC transport system permease protein n=1 Tax=Actinocorallia herbida TaxID=58109 RepID=A0A3N1DBN5_9ACTN|nr:ABC transporter permease [Actinocorallia herbida]ROO90931.1 putative ABC transport system permease protein [Actinocorallia herbida]